MAKAVQYVAKDLIVGAVALTANIPGTAGYTGPSMYEAFGFTKWTFAVSGIGVATVTLYGSVDQTEWTSNAILQGKIGKFLVTDVNAQWVPLGTITASGVFIFDKPLLDAGAAVTAYTSGTITVKVMAVA